MRIEREKLIEHLGSVRIHEVRRLLELDSGTSHFASQKGMPAPQRIERDVINAIHQKLAIILPVKDEDLKVYEGVLTGIPHDCQMIVVSNSQREGPDNLSKERDILEHFCSVTRRTALIVHQKDAQLGKALAYCGYTDVLGDDGLVRNGKAEGMILGILLSILQGKEYIGFIDTDNFIPGAVWEYAQHYAIGFHLAKSPYSIVRILWRYKPKMLGELYFKKWGRVSEITNRYINEFISAKGRFQTEIIKTANAGEHAMSLQLASKLTYATGYGVETQELMSIFEQFSGFIPDTNKAVMQNGVDVMQTETINPHLHEERGDAAHLQDMLLPSLSVIYHNQLCEASTRELIKKQLIDSESIRPDEEVRKIRMIPPPEKANLQKFAAGIEESLGNFVVPSGQMTSLAYQFRREKERKVTKIIFTDLDGSLLHPISYSYASALDSVRQLQKAGIPIVFCSAKTMAEQQVYQKELDIKDPFIIESGSAIVIPREYFKFTFAFTRTLDEHLIIELGSHYEAIREKLKSLSPLYKSKLYFFGDCSTEEIAKITGLNLKMAELVKKREYSETVIIRGSDKQVKDDIKLMQEHGLTCRFGGKFHEVYEGGDKGKAVKILIELFKQSYGDVHTIGIGDSENDLEMLSAVNMPVLVKSGDNKWKKVKVKNLTLADAIGPEGWAKTASAILGKRLV